MRLNLSFLLILLLCVFGAQAQKVKYKTLFPLLEAKNYTEAIPQLKTFLADDKNSDHPNANLQMGMWLESRFLAYDIVDDSTALYATGDSAVTYLSKAKLLITEKELKKNDKFYQAFFRRDLRTGEFGIKISDVHLDIEKKVESVQERLDDVKNMHRNVMKVEDNHKAAMEAYKELVAQY